MPSVAFDFLGTLYSFDKVVDCLHQTFPSDLKTLDEARRFFYEWLWSGLRDYFGTSSAGRYCPLLQTLRATLSRAMRIRNYNIPSPKDIDTVMAAFSDLDPAPTAREALELLKKNGWDIWVATNGGYQSTRSLLERKGILDYFRLEGQEDTLNILSCDDLQISKPHPKVYSELMRLAVHRTQRIENFYFVASHAWDLAGAKNVSFRTVFLTTEEGEYAKDMYNGVGPDIQGDSIIECVERLMELEKTKKHLL